MRFQDMADYRRPISVGDLVAAQWFPDETYYIGEVFSDNGELKVLNMGGEGELAHAYHVIVLMLSEKWRKVLDEVGQRMFEPIVEAFPMVKTGDFPPESSFALDQQIKMAAIQWLHWNYPRE